MLALLRAFYNLLMKTRQDKLSIALVSNNVLEAEEDYLIIKGNLSQEDMRSLYLNRLWDVKIELGSDNQKVAILTLKKGLKDTGKETDDELPFSVSPTM